MIVLSSLLQNRIKDVVAKAASHSATRWLEDYGKVAEEAVAEAICASAKFEPFFSAHEGYAVLREEVDELWEAIKANDFAHARNEAIQVAAMALRYAAENPGGKAYQQSAQSGS
jgi:hypothetical protein